MAKTVFRGGIQEENDCASNYEPVPKIPMDSSNSPLLSKRQADILSRFQIGSSTPDLPLFGTSNGNQSPFIFEPRLAKVGTEVSLARVSTCNSSLYNGIQKTEGSSDECGKNDENLAAVLHCANDLKLENRPIPKISPNQVLLQMEVYGICGTDIELYGSGKLGPWILNEPLVMGHEGSGTVIECGECVKDLKPGDIVAVEPQVPCRVCSLCKTGRYHMCPHIQSVGLPPHNGNFSRFFAHEHDFCHKVPCHLDHELAMLLEPLSVAVHVCKKARISCGDSVMVLGCGPIGLLTMLAAKAYGAASVIVLDIFTYKLKKAMEIGADCAINCKGVPEQEIVKKVHEVLGHWPNKSVDCCGFQAAKRVGMLATAACGTMVIVGMGEHNQSLPIMDTVYKELEVVGAMGCANDFGTALDMVANGKVNPRPIISHHFKMEDMCKAFELASKDDVEHIKMVIHADPKWKPTIDQC